MVPFVQNTGIALLAKTTIAQVRPIHSSIGLNKDMRVWEQINTSNVLNPPTPPCNQPLNITWWPFDGLDPAGDPNRKTIPILLSHLLHRDGTKFECSLSRFAFLWHILILSSDHDDYCHDRGQGSPHHDIGEKCTCSAGRGAGPASLDPTTPPALELELCPAICMFAHHFKGSPLQITLNQAQISVIFYFSSFLFSNVSPIYHLYFLYLLSLSIIEKKYLEALIYYFVSISWSKSPV